jgi:hypothetical protein
MFGTIRNDYDKKFDEVTGRKKASTQLEQQKVIGQQ